MSSFSNISTIRVKYFSSWKSEFVENDQGKYSNLFFRDFQIHKYLNGIFYRLKFISDDFVAQYLSNNNLYVFLNLYMYRFYIYNYVLHFFNVQYLLYDYFFFRFPFVRFYTHYNNEYSYHMNIREFMFLITCSFFNFQLGNFFFKKNFFNVKKINYLNKRSVNFMGFFKYFINIFSSNKFFRKKKISFLRKKKVSFFELFYDKMKDNDNLNYKSNIDIGISIFFIIYLRAILRFCSFLYFFFFTGKSIILYSFFKIYNVICYKLNLVCFFINKFSIYFITSSSGSLKSLLQNYSNDVIFRDYFDDKNYYDFFFSFSFFIWFFP